MASGLRIARTSYDIGSVHKDEVLRYLGYRGQDLSSELDAHLDHAIARCLSLGRPRASLASYAVLHADETSVELEGCVLSLTGRDIARHLSGATEVVLFAATLGAAIDRELQRLSLVDPLGQVLFDAAATALIERTADAVEAEVRAYAAQQGSFTSWRFSPGYGDLPLDIQQPFLLVLDATRMLGITCTPSNLMVPTKSVTALVGLHPTPQPGLASSCDVCSLADLCTLRTTGRTCRG